MSCEYTCDGCGKKEPAMIYPGNPHNYHKPRDWFERSDKDGIQSVCSRECIKKAAEKSGKTSLVLPV